MDARILLAIVGLILVASPGVVARAAGSRGQPQTPAPPEFSGSAQSDATDQLPRTPSNTTPPTVTGTASEGQVVRASGGDWSGGPSLTFGFQWQRCDSTAVACEQIAGARSESYVLSAADVGATVRVAVTASNRGGPSPPAYSPPTSVVASAPLINLEPPAIAGVAEVGRSLAATPGRWQPSEPIDFLYRWLRCKDDGSDCVPIAGATGATHAVRLSDVESRLQIRVTAAGAAGSSTRESAHTAVIRRAPPALMRPFPVVRIKGYATSLGAVLQVVSVTTPRGARVAVLCLGRDCPFRRRTERPGAPVRLRSLERSFGAGTRLQIRVTKPTLIGKYTSVVIRAGAPPSRRDRCLMPNSTRPLRCPAAQPPPRESAARDH